MRFYHLQTKKHGNSFVGAGVVPVRKSGGNIMRKIMLAGIASLAIVSLPMTANAGERTVTGAAIGAGAGAIVAGPVGAVVGGGIGAWVGGPRITRSSAHKRCWRDNAGVRHCHWR
jgi:hypothetical protein